MGGYAWYLGGVDMSRGGYVQGVVCGYPPLLALSGGHHTTVGKWTVSYWNTVSLFTESTEISSATGR